MTLLLWVYYSSLMFFFGADGDWCVLVEFHITFLALPDRESQLPENPCVPTHPVFGASFQTLSSRVNYAEFAPQDKDGFSGIHSPAYGFEHFPRR